MANDSTGKPVIDTSYKHDRKYDEDEKYEDAKLSVNDNYDLK